MLEAVLGLFKARPAKRASNPYAFKTKVILLGSVYKNLHIIDGTELRRRVHNLHKLGQKPFCSLLIEHEFLIEI